MKPFEGKTKVPLALTDKIQLTLLTGYYPKDSADLKKAQAKKVALLFSDFVRQARQSIHIAIYDFRLEDPEAGIVIDALNDISKSGVDVKVAYFQPSKKRELVSDFSRYGGDPAPEPDRSFLERLRKNVQFKAIVEIGVEQLPSDVTPLPIEAGGQLMHSKYIIRDGLSPSAAVWTGSANFTTDAWSIQDNNIVTLESQDLAGNYETDFAELWATGRIAGTGKNDFGETNIDCIATDVDFAPGDGPAMDLSIAGHISKADSEILLSSMVISSGTVLGALVDAMERGVKITGVYDGPQMDQVIKDFEKSTHGTGQAKILQWNTIKGNLVPKHSTPYSPNGTHDFMHNKALVVDQRVVATGSYNFSMNATRNAENMITMYDQAIASQYKEYIKSLISRYGSS
ncbi:MAG TPA: phosphatidylserine/phosphatidylglycerophosphate/cardiolipin synthase family protein [Methanocella sp.]|nr:phosphatidylserine/phosphatidylglycerophosphate/cardiolipin synthase family protein [Methanocella sp.]